MNHPKFISAIIGTAAAGGLFLFYALTMRFLAGSWGAVWWQFRQLWYLMIPLVIGFGVQIGLFSYIKRLVKTGMSREMVVAGSTTSTLGMIACCAHHTADVVPLLGFSAISLWLTNYQAPLLLLGIFSNAVGITYLWRIKKSIRQ